MILRHSHKTHSKLHISKTRIEVKLFKEIPDPDRFCDISARAEKNKEMRYRNGSKLATQGLDKEISMGSEMTPFIHLTSRHLTIKRNSPSPLNVPSRIPMGQVKLCLPEKQRARDSHRPCPEVRAAAVSCHSAWNGAAFQGRSAPAWARYTGRQIPEAPPARSSDRSLKNGNPWTDWNVVQVAKRFVCEACLLAAKAYPHDRFENYTPPNLPRFFSLSRLPTSDREYDQVYTPATIELLHRLSFVQPSSVAETRVNGIKL